MVGGFALFRCDPALRELVAALPAKRPPIDVEDLDHLRPVLDDGLVDVIVLHTDRCDAEILERISRHSGRDALLVVLVAADVAGAVPAGADIVIDQAVAKEALVGLFGREVPPWSRPAAERLVGVSVLDGIDERSLDAASREIAIAFDVERCLIAFREEGLDGAPTEGQTLDRVTWSHLHDRARAALACGATLIARDLDGSCETYLAASVVTAAGKGFVALVSPRPRRFERDDARALASVGKRFGHEHGFRAAYKRATDDLERLMHGPGLDPLTGTWNRAALAELAAMQVSAMSRSNRPLIVAVLDVVELHAINTRHGLDAGDRVLRRVADALRAALRQEDLIGRWGGDEIAIVLPMTGADGANRVIERIRVMLAERSVALARDSLELKVSYGLAAPAQGEAADALITRAARAAKRAQQVGVEILGAEDLPAASGRRTTRDFELPREDIGALLGDSYRLLHEISRGGMGVVYRAEDLALERPVAIKMLRPDIVEDPDLLERLRAEAAMLARLQHPNLVQIYSFGQRAGDSYLVMELVEGQSLEEAFERHVAEHTTMPIAELAVVVDQVASALDLLHERGIIHRDVKPANVILDPFRGRSVLVDVGVASRIGQTVAAAGTPGFVAPEIVKGGEATARSDVYGLAATAYALLVLARPWGQGNLPEILTRQLTEPLPPLSQYRRELAAADQLFAGALSVEPARRPASAGAFARDLQTALRGMMPSRMPNTTFPPLVAAQVASPSSGKQTRGVVFRAVTGAIGVRDAARLRDVIGSSDQELALALTDAAPLAWLSADVFVRMLAATPRLIARDPDRVARDIARAAVRASFRRFFPTSTATLDPERTLSAIRNVWARYQTWGMVTSQPISSSETVVRITGTLRVPAICEWTCGMIEQLVILSGGHEPIVTHEQCEVSGAPACTFRAVWSELELQGGVEQER